MKPTHMAKECYGIDCCSQEFFEVKNELTFPFVNTLLYIISYIIFIENLKFSMDFVSYLKNIYLFLI